MCGTFDPLSNLAITGLEEDGFLRTFKELLLVATKIKCFILSLIGVASRDRKICPETSGILFSANFDVVMFFVSRVRNTFSGTFWIALSSWAIWRALSFESYTPRLRVIIHENLALLKFLLLGDLDFRRIDISFGSLGRVMPSVFFNSSAAWLAFSSLEKGPFLRLTTQRYSSKFVWISSKKSPSSISVVFFNYRISDSLTIRFSVEVFACPDWIN